MKIMAVSDQVLDFLYSSKVWHSFPDIDLIVGCGDLPFYYLDFLASALDAPLIYVRGNHDHGRKAGKKVRSFHKASIDRHETPRLAKWFYLVKLSISGNV